MNQSSYVVCRTEASYDCPWVWETTPMAVFQDYAMAHAWAMARFDHFQVVKVDAPVAAMGCIQP